MQVTGMTRSLFPLSPLIHLINRAGFAREQLRIDFLRIRVGHTGNVVRHEARPAPIAITALVAIDPVGRNDPLPLVLDR